MKTILITGATDGIGKQTALNMATKKNHVIIVGRNKEKSEATCDEIAKKTHNDNIEFIVSDLSLISDVKFLGNHIKENYPKLDVLINNVGALFVNREETEEGFEKTFALNHLGTFTLTLELLDFLKDNSSARIVNVASAAHFNVIDKSSNEKSTRSFIETKFFGTDFDIQDLQASKNYKGTHQYSRTKLMNILFTYKLASDYLKDSNITANCLHPGFVASKFGHNNGGFFKAFLKLGQRMQAISVIDGARASTFLALSSDVEKINGKYFDEDCSQIKSSGLSYIKYLQDNLWEQSKDLINMI